MMHSFFEEATFGIGSSYTRFSSCKRNRILVFGFCQAKCLILMTDIETIHNARMICYTFSMTPYHFFMPAKMVAALRSLSERTGLKVSDLIRRSIEDYLRKQAKKRPVD